MANHHPKLASLAKALAYRKGDLESLEKREDELFHALEEVRRKKGDAEQSIQQLSALIEAFRVDPDDVRSIRAMPRKEGSAHGAFRGTLVKQWQLITCGSVTTRTKGLASLLSPTFG